MRWVDIHPSYGVRGAGDAGEGFPCVPPDAWRALDEDGRCAAELEFAAEVLRWVRREAKGRTLVFELDMPDADERGEVLATAERLGARVDSRPGGVLAGALAAGLEPSLVTCTQLWLRIERDRVPVVEIAGYLDSMKVYVAPADLESLAVALRPVAARHLQ